MYRKVQRKSKIQTSLRIIFYPNSKYQESPVNLGRLINLDLGFELETVDSRSLQRSEDEKSWSGSTTRHEGRVTGS